MSNRGHVRTIPTDPVQALQVMAEIIAELTERIDNLEARGQVTLPADYRFEEAAGVVSIRRVSTTNTAPITPPL